MYDTRTKKTLYAMARVVTDLVPEIKDRTACRAALAAAGFKPAVIEQHLRKVQDMARTIRGRDADNLQKKLMDQS